MSPLRLNELVAPPRRGLASASVTSAPASLSAIAAVMPARPPPITTILPGALTGRLPSRPLLPLRAGAVPPPATGRPPALSHWRTATSGAREPRGGWRLSGPAAGGG